LRMPPSGTARDALATWGPWIGYIALRATYERYPVKAARSEIFISSTLS
jgi:hypothetical protein